MWCFAASSDARCANGGCSISRTRLPPNFRRYIAAASLARFASSGITTLIGYHLYALTRDPQTIGWLGLCQAIPAIGLVLFGGVVADRFDRKSLVLGSCASQALVCVLLALTSLQGDRQTIVMLYVAGFLMGCIGAVLSPLVNGLESDLVPAESAMRHMSVLSSFTQASWLLGPAVASVLFDLITPQGDYAALAAMLLIGAAVLSCVSVPPQPRLAASAASVIAHVGEGLRFAFNDQVLLGSMALDLFAVFFGGATALLPAYASDVLGIGSTGFAILRSAMPVGSLLAMLIVVRHPPNRRAGLAMHAAVAGFGLAIILFALSRNVVVSFVALGLAGACDAISVVVRRAVLRLAAPGAMRGRLAAVRMVFINSSNELGDFESGMLAGAIGIVPTVWVGGVITLCVVAITAWRAPKLRRLDLSTFRAADG